MTDARRIPVWVLVVVGVALGAALGLGASALLADDDGRDELELQPVRSPYPEDQATNADAFLEAWDRYRRATFRADLTFVRELPDGRRLEVQRLVVQQPPRRAVRQLDSTTEVADDGTLLCEPRGGDRVCTQIDGNAYESAIADELASWRTAITGHAPAYAVDRHDDGCFELRLVASLSDPPYGEATFVCFDADTGTLEHRQVIRTTGTDTEQATAISGAVTETDWQEVAG